MDRVEIELEQRKKNAIDELQNYLKAIEIKILKKMIIVSYLMITLCLIANPLVKRLVSPILI